MRTLLFVISIQVFCLLMLASTFSSVEFREGKNEWANMTAKQFR